VAAQGADGDVRLVRLAGGERAVVGPDEPVTEPVVDVVHGEEPGLRPPRPAVAQGGGAVDHPDLQVGPPVHIEDAPRGPHRQRGRLPARRGEGVLGAVEAAADVRPAEGADQPVRDALALERREGRVAGRDLGAVRELEPSRAHRVPGLARGGAQPEVPLLQEEAGRVLVAVRGMVGGAEAELSLRRRGQRVVGEPQQDGSRELELPAEPRALLREAGPKGGAEIGVIARRRAPEPAPGLGPAPEAGIEDDLSRGRGRRGLRLRPGPRRGGEQEHEGGDASVLGHRIGKRGTERVGPDGLAPPGRCGPPRPDGAGRPARPPDALTAGLPDRPSYRRGPPEPRGDGRRPCRDFSATRIRHLPFRCWRPHIPHGSPTRSGGGERAAAARPRRRAR
jgi:hypothetical protein